jgi:cell division protein FtsW
MVSLAYGIGMMLALTRQRPRTEMESIGDANADAVRGYA